MHAHKQAYIPKWMNLCLYLPFRRIHPQRQRCWYNANRMISRFQLWPVLDSYRVEQLDWNTQNVTYLIARYLSMHSWFAESETENPSHINTFNYYCTRLHFSTNFSYSHSTFRVPFINLIARFVQYCILRSLKHPHSKMLSTNKTNRPFEMKQKKKNTTKWRIGKRRMLGHMQLNSFPSISLNITFDTCSWSIFYTYRMYVEWHRKRERKSQRKRILILPKLKKLWMVCFSW